jgi:hypothetical protein
VRKEKKRINAQASGKEPTRPAASGHERDIDNTIQLDHQVNLMLSIIDTDIKTFSDLRYQ